MFFQVYQKKMKETSLIFREFNNNRKQNKDCAISCVSFFYNKEPIFKFDLTLIAVNYRRLELERSERDVTSSSRCASCIGITGRKSKGWRPREYIHTRMNVHERCQGKGETQWKMHFTLFSGKRFIQKFKLMKNNKTNIGFSVSKNNVYRTVITRKENPW